MNPELWKGDPYVADASLPRLAGILAVLAVGLGWLGWRLFEIQVRNHTRLRATARQYSETTRIIEAKRGEIRDRNGNVLAISAPERTVYINLALCSNRVDQVARTCGPLLGQTPANLAARLNAALQNTSPRGTARRSLVLKRHLPLAESGKASGALWDSRPSALGRRRLWARRKANFGTCATTCCSPAIARLDSTLMGKARPRF